MLTKASQELLNKGSSNLPVEMMYCIVPLRIKVFLLLLKEVSPKSKTLVKFKSLCCNIDMSIFFYSVQEGQSFFRIVVTLEEIVRTNFNFTFSTTAKGVKRIMKTVFELVFSKMTYTMP